jgi:hypothetical protein
MSSAAEDERITRSLLNRSPKTNDEWIIHALNIHGFPFERKCQEIVSKTGNITLVSTNYPVKFPHIGGKESSADIWAELGPRSKRLTLIIECKKHNPELARWIFFPKGYGQTQAAPSLPYLSTEQRSNSYQGYYWFPQITAMNLLGPKMQLVNDAREVRESYLSFKGDDKKKTKTSSDTIQDAAHQVSLATQSIVEEEAQKIASNIPGYNVPVSQHFMPIIVTTARISICNFEPENVNLTNGELPFENVKLEEQPYLLYEYPLPRSLQFNPKNVDFIDKNYWYRHEQMIRMHIVVIQSDSFPEFLDILSSKADMFP